MASDHTFYITFYKLRHVGDEKEVYIGSTECFVGRKQTHRNACNNPCVKSHNSKVYKYIRANGGYSAWCYDVLEQHPHGSMTKKQRYTREYELIQEHKATLHANKPGVRYREGGKTNNQQ